MPVARQDVIRRAALLVVALFWVILVRLSLGLFSMKFIRRMLLPTPAVSRPDLDPASVVWAVRRAASAVPFASCLTQALAAQIMLARRRCPTTLHVGVKRDVNGTFGAHAWLESNGRLLLGGTRASLKSFVRLAVFPSADE